MRKMYKSYKEYRDSKFEISMHEVGNLLKKASDLDKFKYLKIDGKKYLWDEFESIPASVKKKYYRNLWSHGKTERNGLKLELAIERKKSKSISVVLTISNTSREDYYLFVSGILEDHFKFKHVESGIVECAGVETLISGENPGQIMKSGMKIKYHLKFKNTNFAGRNDKAGSIDFKPGTYQCYCEIEVDSGLHCRRSQLSYKDVKKNADALKMKLWKGNSVSNIMKFGMG